VICGCFYELLITNNIYSYTTKFRQQHKTINTSTHFPCGRVNLQLLNRERQNIAQKEV